MARKKRCKKDDEFERYNIIIDTSLTEDDEEREIDGVSEKDWMDYWEYIINHLDEQ